MSNDTLDARLDIRLNRADAVALAKIAARLDRKVSDVGRIAIREYLAREGKTK